MIDVLREIPINQRDALLKALQFGSLKLNTSLTGLQAAIGTNRFNARLLAELNAWHALGMTTQAAAAALGAIEQALRERPPVDLVFSGDLPSGFYAQDTQSVYDRLLGNAEQQVWLTSYNYYDGKRVFGVLANRMAERPQLMVNLLLNIRRRSGASQDVERSIDTFARNLRSAWPGIRRPSVYFDPSFRDGGAAYSVLHAKSVVVDQTWLFITSANLTESAAERNIELGVVMKDPVRARSVAKYYASLLETNRLERLNWE
jgi:hypothetical protein